MANSEQMNMLMNQLSHKLGAQSGEVENAVKNGDLNKVLDKLPQGQKSQVESILNDPQKAQQVLNNPQVQALLKKLMG